MVLRCSFKLKSYFLKLIKVFMCLQQKQFDAVFSMPHTIVIVTAPFVGHVELVCFD